MNLSCDLMDPMRTSTPLVPEVDDNDIIAAFDEQMDGIVRKKRNEAVERKRLLAEQRAIWQAGSGASARP